MSSLFDDRRQILLGSLLGNGYICKGRQSHYFCMRHSVRHLSWLKTKARELQEYECPSPFYEYKKTVTWRSSCNPIFTELREICYKEDEKTVTMDWLDQLRDLAIAVWFGDSGGMTGRGRKNAILRTQSFGPEGNQIIERYFNEVGLPCKLNKNRKSQILLFTIAATERLIGMIEHCIPSDKIFKMMPGQE